MKKIIWAIVAVVGAGIALYLLLAPTSKTTAYDEAVSAPVRFGVTADERQKEAAAALAANPPVGPDTEACAIAKKALNQQRVAMKAFKNLPAYDPKSAITQQQVAELLAKRTTLLQQSVQTRAIACGGDREE